MSEKMSHGSLNRRNVLKRVGAAGSIGLAAVGSTGTVAGSHRIYLNISEDNGSRVDYEFRIDDPDLQGPEENITRYDESARAEGWVSGYYEDDYDFPSDAKTTGILAHSKNGDGEGIIRYSYSGGLDSDYDCQIWVYGYNDGEQNGYKMKGCHLCSSDYNEPRYSGDGCTGGNPCCCQPSGYVPHGDKDAYGGNNTGHLEEVVLGPEGDGKIYIDIDY
jgi:hypothetical protein